MENTALTTEDINALGQILDSTWGKWSTQSAPTRSIKCHLEGDKLVAKYITIVTILNDQLHVQEKKFEDEAAKLVKDYIATVKKKFKEKTGKPLKIKEDSANSSLEIISRTTPATSLHLSRFPQVSTRDFGYFRRNTVFTVK